MYNQMNSVFNHSDKLEALGWKPLAGDWQQKLQTTIREEMEKAN